MAHNAKLSNSAANASADAACALCNAGFIDIMSGTQATDADTALGAQVVLAVLPFNATAFGAAVAGVATANAITADAAADATGTATWFRAYKSNHTSAVFDGSVGTSGADLNITGTVAIVAGANVSISSFTYTQAKV